jgi:PAS domain S-box-containing protein
MITEILNQNLEILLEETDAVAGFILKISKSGFETVASFNDNNFDIIPLGNDLRRLYLSNLLNTGKISESDSYLYLSVEKDIKSFLFENICQDKDKNELYLLLFSNKKENFSKDKLTTIRKYIKEVNKQINQTSEIEISDNFTLAGKEAVYGEWFTKNRELIFSTLLNSYNDLLFVLDENGYIIAINKAGAQNLDYPELDLRGRHLLEFIKSEEKQMVMNSLKKMLTEEVNMDFDVNLLSKYENQVPYHLSCSLIRDGKKITGILGTGSSLKEINNLRAKNIDLSNKFTEASRLINIEKSRSDIYKDILADMNRLRNDFVSNLSHEFRTPLASIIGFAETLLSDKDMPEEMRREFDEIILQEGKRLAKLINDILELSRYEQGKIDLSKTEFDLSELLKSIVEEITPSIEGKKLILTCSLPDEPAVLFADKEKIRLVIHGILNNAIKYTPSKGRITCMVKIFREEVETIITDTGAGIPEKDFPYIFHKFHHSSKGSKEFREDDMDLVFMKQIIDLHRGIIKVQSEPEKGTSVLFKLPSKLKH